MYPQIHDVHPRFCLAALENGNPRLRLMRPFLALGFIWLMKDSWRCLKVLAPVSFPLLPECWKKSRQPWILLRPLLACYVDVYIWLVKKTLCSYLFLIAPQGARFTAVSPPADQGPGGALWPPLIQGVQWRAPGVGPQPCWPAATSLWEHLHWSATPKGELVC